MIDREQVRDAVMEVAAEVLDIGKDQIANRLDEDVASGLSMTSMQLFPLIASLSERFDVDIDYHGFLTDVHSLNDAIDFTLEAANRN